jgi:hypothetical protein
VILAQIAYFSRAYWLPNSVDLCFSGDSDSKLREVIPWTIGETDVMFAFDQSGSMAGMIDGAKADAHKLMKSISARLGNESFGVAGFSDYVDFPYRLYQPLTNKISEVQEAINSLTLADGGDTPEAYTRMMYESYMDSSIGWREESKRYLIIFGDSFPHDPDAGRDGQINTDDDLALDEVLSQMESKNITLLFVADPTVANDTDLLSQWENWTDGLGGMTIRCRNP